MRAARIAVVGSAPAPADVAAPEAGDRHVLHVLAVALNPLDLAVAAGRFYGGHPPLPYTPGSEAVARAADGARVYVFGDGLGVARDGTLAEQATVASHRLVPADADVEDATAVALGIAGIIAWDALERARVGPGDRVLVLGATGTAGSVAVQGAKLRGAERVVAVGRDPGRLERARALGADAAVTLDGDLAAAFHREGPTVVLDALWGAPVEAAVAIAAQRARIVHFGQSAGPEATFKSAAIRGKELELLGQSNFARTKEELHATHAELLRRVEAGELEVDFKKFALEDVEEAWTHQANGGKAVVVL
ncbi:MAG: zinc-binding alcohol dehydrogenase family protein [Gaiellaceae bacterium]